MRPATLLKKRLWHRCFRVNLANVLRTVFLIEYFRWLLLHISLTNSSNSHYKSSEFRVWPFKHTQVSLFVYTTHQVHVRKNHKANGNVKFNNIKLFWKSLRYTSYSVHLLQKWLKKSVVSDVYDSAFKCALALSERNRLSNLMHCLMQKVTHLN